MPHSWKPEGWHAIVKKAEWNQELNTGAALSDRSTDSRNPC